jgi:hypothetical protein
MATGEAQEGGQPLAGAEVRRAALAVVAGWVVPGLGHVILGRAARGALFAALIVISFSLGLLHDGRLALRDRNQPFLSSLQVVANVGVGVPDLVARWAVYGGAIYALPRDPAFPAYGERSKVLRDRARSPVSLYGTAYLWTAGLMNLLLLFEVWDIALRRRDP